MIGCHLSKFIINCKSFNFDQLHFCVMSLEVLSKLKQPGTGGLNYFVAAHVGGAGIKMRFTDANDSTNFVDLPLLKAQDTVSLLGQVRRVSNEFDNRFNKSICRGAVVSISQFAVVQSFQSQDLSKTAKQVSSQTGQADQMPEQSLFSNFLLSCSQQDKLISSMTFMLIHMA